MSKKADMIYEELKNREYIDLFDSESLKFSQLVPRASQVNEPLWNHHKWVLGNCEKGKKVLDVGCGFGHLVKMLKLKGCLPVGVDNNEGMIKEGETDLPDIVFIKADVEKELTVSSDFDIVTCIQVLEHLKEPKKAIENMLKVLKPDGKLIITVPIMRSLYVKGHINFWNIYEIYEMFKEFGNDFKIYWLTKRWKYGDDDEPNEKNLFGIIFHKNGK